MSSFFERVNINPVIACINDLNKLDIALDSPAENIFLLTGNIFNLREISNKVLSKDKGLYIHIDCIDGFSKDTWGLEYIVKNIRLDGIITGKKNLVKLSKDMGVFTIQRIFIPDLTQLEEGLASIRQNRPHAIEFLPGIMPKIIKRIIKETKIPLIAGGLVMDEEDIAISMDSGAIAISTDNEKCWFFRNITLV